MNPSKTPPKIQPKAEPQAPTTDSTADPTTDPVRSPDAPVAAAGLSDETLAVIAEACAVNVTVYTRGQRGRERRHRPELEAAVIAVLSGERRLGEAALAYAHAAGLTSTAAVRQIERARARATGAVEALGRRRGPARLTRTD